MIHQRNQQTLPRKPTNGAVLQLELNQLIHPRGTTCHVWRPANKSRLTSHPKLAARLLVGGAIHGPHFDPSLQLARQVYPGRLEALAVPTPAPGRAWQPWQHNSLML